MKFLEKFKFEFTINTLFIGILILIVGSGVTSYYLANTNLYDIPTGALPVPIQVGKNKIIVSKTGDASMRTEYNRRRAIIGSNSCSISPKFSYKDSTNGSLETFFISGLCPTYVKQPNLILDSIENVISAITGQTIGNSTNTQDAPILDGGGSSIENKTNVFANAGSADTDYSKTTKIDFGSAK